MHASLIGQLLFVMKYKMYPRQDMLHKIIKILKPEVYL